MCPGVLEFSTDEKNLTANFENENQNQNFIPEVGWEFNTAGITSAWLANDFASGLDPASLESISGTLDLQDDEPCEPTANTTPASEPSSERLPLPRPATAEATPRIRTRGEVIEAQVESLEQEILELDREEHGLAERLSSCRKQRKELLSELRKVEGDLRYLIAEGGYHDLDPSSANLMAWSGRTANNLSASQQGTQQASSGSSPQPQKNTSDTSSAPAAAPSATIPDPGKTALLSAIGCNEKQAEKFAEADIRTICEFEQALSDRTIERVRGIQERTMDKLKDALIQWRNQNGYGAEPETVASETESPSELASGASSAPETTPERTLSEVPSESLETALSAGPAAPQAETTPAPSEITQPEVVPEPAPPRDLSAMHREAYEAGRKAVLEGRLFNECSFEPGEELRKHWEDGWQDGYPEHEATKANNAQDCAGEAGTKKAARKPRKKKNAADEAAGSVVGSS